MKRFQINPIASIKALSMAFLFLAFGAIVMIFFIYRYGFQKIDFICLAIPGIVYFLPTIIVWIQYLINDNGKVLLIENNVFTYSDSKKNITISFNENDISEVRVVKRNLPGDLGLPGFPWHYFFYIDIILKNQKNIRLSFLTTPNPDIFRIDPVIINKPLPFMG